MNRIVPVSELRLGVSDAGWDFAAKYRAEIGRHWQLVAAEKPALWNGEVLLCTEAEVRDGVFIATLVKSDYASFIAWRDWGRPDQSVRNCFGVPAVFSNDGALLIGVMSGWTLNAGKAYPPSGTLEPKDIGSDGTVDVAGSMRGELLEETGLDLAEARAGEIVAIFEGPRLALARRYDFALSFAQMQARFARHQALEETPELAAIEAAWNGTQVDARMPGYAQDIIGYFHRRHRSIP